MINEALIFAVAGIATAGVLVRPFGWPEAVWAVLGAGALVMLGLIPAAVAWTGIRKGADVYLFLTGMMLLSELARREELFDWLAALATEHARGSPGRLFLLVYLVGTLVTVFLSNDAAAVVLTPAVYAATQAARVGNPLPFLLACAFVANAASFVLPISNPANLVIFGGGLMPPLRSWLGIFAIPSLVSIAVTYAALRLRVHRQLLGQTLAVEIEPCRLSASGKAAAAGIVLTAIVLLSASALGYRLGVPTLGAGIATAALVLAIGRKSFMPVLRGISWNVLPLVAGLFVLVEALDRAGLTASFAETMHPAARAPGEFAAVAGAAIAVLTNVVNNLPAGLIAASALHHAHAPDLVTNSVLIGVDLGPNLSVTGSLATILWLAALRREKQDIGAARFLMIGLAVMPPALVLSILALIME